MKDGECVTPFKPKRNLGFWRVFFVIFSAVGSGPAGIEGIVSSANSISLALIAIAVFPLFIAVPEALITLELTKKFGDTNGGASVWFKKIYHSNFFSFLQTSFLVLYDCSTSALVAESTILYIGTLVPWFSTYIWQAVASLAIIFVSYGISYVSLDFVAKTVTILTLHTVVVYGLLVGYSAKNFSISRLDNPVDGGRGVHWAYFINLLVFNSCGYDAAASIITFVKNPDRTVPYAIFAASVVVAVMYETILLVTYAGSKDPASSWDTGFFAKVAGEVAGRWLQIWIIVASSLINLQLFIAALTSAIYSLQGAASLGAMPSWFAVVDAKSGTPRNALLFCGAISILFGFVPFQINLALESVLYSFLILGQIACFFSVKPSEYFFLTKSAWVKYLLILPPAIIAAFSIAVQNSMVIFFTFLVVLLFMGIGGVMSLHQGATAPRKRELLKLEILL